MCAPVVPLHADENAKAASGELSNQAFALLNSLAASNPDGSANAGGKSLVGPIASFAGDAQTLNQALGAGDTAAARRATAALDADAASVDSALKAHQGAIKAAEWDSLKHQLAAIERSVPPAPASSAVAASAAPPVAAAPPAVPVAGAAAPATDAGPSGAGATASSGAAAAGPSIKIESRHTVGDVTRIKGYFEGTALKSAGIYEGDQNVKPIRVDHVIGQQKVDFELALRDADVMTNVRVFDQAGRMATASVFGEESTALASSGHESGVVVDRGAGATEGSNTAEIPSARAPASGGLEGSSPGADEGPDGGGSGGLGGGLGGGGLSSPVGNVQINIESINPVNALSHTYQVAGQIIGRGVHSAAIYVDGRPVKRIPVSRGAPVSNFHTTFMMNGASATIRAFGAGNQYVESSIELPPAVASSPPIVVAPINPYVPFGMNPYETSPFGGMYGSPYGSPYGYNISPFGISRYPVNPYAASPYGGAPFGVNPYAAPINPYNTTVPPMGPAGR